MINSKFRCSIVESVRRWIGTPYVHQASTLGHGADCLGLIRGVWREIVGEEPENVPNYLPNWGQVSGDETLLNAADRWFERISSKEAMMGDLLLFRWKNSGVAGHAAILTDADRFVHAYEKAGVVETALGNHWRRRIAAAYRFPQADGVR
ncbi:MAG: NlpC/P60 family protein [Pseudomonadota bacterium]